MNPSDQFGLSALSTPEEAASKAAVIHAHIFQNGEFSKNNAQAFLNDVHAELSSNKASPVSKCMTLHVLID